MFGLDRTDVRMKPLRAARACTAGTILGRIGRTARRAARRTLLFEIRPAGRGAPRDRPEADPRRLEAARVDGDLPRGRPEPVLRPGRPDPSIGQILLMSKEALRAARAGRSARPDLRLRPPATSAPARSTAACWRRSSSCPPPASSRRSRRCRCGHRYLTASGNVSEHSTGTAVDIAAINGIPILGHQGQGSITELTIQRLLTLQGAMKPHQIISLMAFPGTDNTFAMADHDDHIHVGFRPLYGANSTASRQSTRSSSPSSGPS